MKKGFKHSDETKHKISIAKKGFKHSDETKHKISIAGLGRQSMLGKQHTELTKLKISLSQQGRIFSDEHKINLSNAAKGRCLSDYAKYRISLAHEGKQLSEAHKQKIRSFMNTSDGKDACRRGGLKGALVLHTKYPQKGDGFWFNTKPEKEMKRCLEENGIKYEFQKIIEFPKYFYKVDFYLPLYNTVIEVDGKWCHNYPNGTSKDKLKIENLENVGYRVLRFWEDEFDVLSVWREI